MGEHGGNRLQLGVFGTNLDGGLTVARLEDGHRLGWPQLVEIAQLADAAGFELQAPVARWRAIGDGPSQFQGTNYETMTWAAGLGAVTQRSKIFATVHVPVIHPIVAAKQLTTIDHITGGRSGVNVVCGWFQAEFEMFGSQMLGHEARYEYAAEWVSVVRRLWTSEESFEFEGRFFQIAKGWHQPKPLSRPHPPIMNAGSSPTGMRFMAQHADIGFVHVPEDEPLDATTARLATLRTMAREEFGRSIQLWSSGYVVCRPTEREARQALAELRAQGDMTAIDAAPEGMGPSPSLPPDEFERRRRSLVTGWGSPSLAGTPEQIIERLAALSKAGVDGVVLVWPNYLEGLRAAIAELLPLLEQAGLRAPASAG